MATQELTYEEIRRNIQRKQFAPIYFLQGEEPYFIDRLTDLLIENVLDDSERDFNQTIVYGSETDIYAVMNAAKRFPMMAARQLVVVKEAKNLKNMEELIHYVQSPQQATVLVVNYKYATLDGRKKLSGEIARKGILFESKKIYENKIPAFIISYLQERELSIDGKSAQILTDFLGTNLSKLSNELDKLGIALSESASKRITPELIEQHIGISKDFNNYELQTAIASRDVLKANRIIEYFKHNSKNNPLIVSLTVLFNFFSNLMICHFETNKSDANLMSKLGLRFAFQFSDYQRAMKTYNAFKTMEIISQIRLCDAKAKGVDNPSTPDDELLKELAYKIMH
ncbi:MAG: DNA polymerase III subunit delta [Dysgonamonadaceae bacterium]|jgi:DNA polymerase-3 subunit delta|nr:DNA polymerase III subunit delta [Dysgonamonadaceae bacterium]